MEKKRWVILRHTNAPDDPQGCHFDLLLEDHLERNDGLRPLLAAEVDIPELAPSEGLADVEVGQRPDRCA